MIKRSKQKVVSEALRTDYVVKSEQERGPSRMIYKKKQRGKRREQRQLDAMSQETKRL